MNKITRGIAASLLCATLAASFITVSPVPSATGSRVADAPTSAHAAASAEEVVGTGWLKKLACIGCMTGIGIASGGTVVGFLAVVTLFPEGVAACAVGCYLAYKD